MTHNVLFRMSQFLYSKSGWILSLFLTAVMVLYASVIMGSQSRCISVELPNGHALLGLRFGYDLNAVQQLFSSVSSEALRCYARLLRIWDNIFPILYGSMYISWLSLIFRSFVVKHKAWQLINLYPVVPVILDFVENYFEQNLISEFMNSGQIMEYQVNLASWITRIKWLFSSVNYILIITGIVLVLIPVLRKIRI